MLIVKVRVRLALLSLPPPLQFPPGVAVSWTLPKFAEVMVVAKVTLNVAVQLAVLYVK